MKPFQDRILRQFLLSLLLWLPVMYTAWYMLADHLLVPVYWFSEQALALIAAGSITEIYFLDRIVSIETTLRMQTPDGQVGYLLVEVSPLKYCWSLPLLLALTLSSGLRPLIGLRVVAAWIALAPFQAWGVVFEYLMRISVYYGPEVAGQLGYGEFTRETIILGYQFGYLVLPFVSTVVLWIGLHRGFIRRFVQRPT